MRAVSAIALLTIRTAIRSRVVLSLLAVLLLVTVGLPLTVKGDGTLEGHIQIVIGYTLGIATFLLSISTLWSGCAAVSAEIAGRQIQILATKPVPRGAIWLGKWTGLMFLNLLMVAFCAAATYGILHWTTRGDGWTDADRRRLDEDLLIARQEVRPPQPDVDLPAQAELEARARAGRIAADANPATLLEVIKMELRARNGAVAPGQGMVWDLALPHPPRGADSITVRYKHGLSQVGLVQVKTQWRVGTPDQPERFRTEQSAAPNAPTEFKVPASALGDATTIRIACGNIDDQGSTIVFADNDALIVLLPDGGFAANFVRSALTLLGQLGLFTALGLTAGSVFSMPVASFTALFAVLVMSLGGTIHDMAQTEVIVGTAKKNGPVLQTANVVLHGFYSSLEVALKPLEFEAPWDDLARSRQITWSRVARSVGVNGLLYSGLLWLLGVAVLNRREVALPPT